MFLRIWNNCEELQREIMITSIISSQHILVTLPIVLVRILTFRTGFLLTSFIALALKNFESHYHIKLGILINARQSLNS